MSDTPLKSNLGRGLSALFGDDTPAAALIDEPGGTREVPIEYLRPNPTQPRQHFDSEAVDELAQSILANGMLQPILVRPDPTEPESYQIVAGERRWRAAQKARLHQVPVIVKSLTDEQTLELALVENLQRQDLSALEEAEAYQRLIDDFSRTHDEIAKAVGKSRPHIANTLRLLGLPNLAKTLLVEGRLSAGHARALLGASDPDALARMVIARGLNVRQTERLAKQSTKAPVASLTRTLTEKDPDTRALEQDLSNLLGLKVGIEQKTRGGHVTIRYDDLEQLDGLLLRLGYNAEGTVRAYGT